MSEHFQFASYILPVLLAVLFKFMLQHSYLPDSFMLTILVPILISKTGNITSTVNYHPLALATLCSKIMETCLVSRLESFLYTNYNQFAYKRGTQLICVYICLKMQLDVILNIVACPVYACFLGASKSFDKLYHWILLKNLKQCGCPVYIVKVLVHCYQKQKPTCLTHSVYQMALSKGDFISYVVQHIC